MATGGEPCRATGATGRLGRVAWCSLAAGLFIIWCPAPPAEVGHSPRETPAAVAPRETDRRETVFATPRDGEAWACLPHLTRGEKAPLPLWARALARSLPRTTAAMLELDLAHRAASPLDPRLRGQIRWAAARALRCDYGEAYALADLRVAGAGEDEIRALTSEPEKLPDETRRILAFVRRLSRAGYLVTDEEVGALVGRHGAERVVAIVLCVAYSNFLDRLALALGLPVEPGGPRPPLDVRFERRAFGAGTAPPRSPPGAESPPPDASGLKDPDWRPRDLPDIRGGLEAQKVRRPRIPLPENDPSANRWGLVGRTYQPALATAWSACTQAFAEEADQDPVFEQSVFWIVTRTKQCFY